MSKAAQNATDVASHDTAHGADSPGVRRVVITACMAAIALFIGAVAVLYGGWVGQENPSGLIVVQGDASIADATVSVRPLGGEATAALTAQFKNAADYRLRFHVPHGRYEVRIQGEGMQSQSHALDTQAAPVVVEAVEAVSRTPATRPRERAKP